MKPLLKTSWQELPPGWRWLIWGIGAGIAGFPVARAFLSSGIIQERDIIMSLILAGMLTTGFLMVQGGRVVKLVLTALILIVGTWYALPRIRSARAAAVSCVQKVSCQQLNAIFVRVDECYERGGRPPHGDGIAFLAWLQQSGDAPELIGPCPKEGKDEEAPSLNLPGGTRIVTDYVPNPVAADILDRRERETWPITWPPPALVPFIWERKPFHDDGTRRTVLYADGVARIVNESTFQAELSNFQALLAKGKP